MLAFFILLIVWSGRWHKIKKWHPADQYHITVFVITVQYHVAVFVIMSLTVLLRDASFLHYIYVFVGLGCKARSKGRIFSLYPLTAVMKSYFVYLWFFGICRSSSSHRCSIRFKSEFWGSQGSMEIPFSSKNFFNYFCFIFRVVIMLKHVDPIDSKFFSWLK